MKEFFPNESNVATDPIRFASATELHRLLIQFLRCDFFSQITLDYWSHSEAKIFFSLKTNAKKKLSTSWQSVVFWSSVFVLRSLCVKVFRLQYSLLLIWWETGPKIDFQAQQKAEKIILQLSRHQQAIMDISLRLFTFLLKRVRVEIFVLIYIIILLL